MFIPLRSPDSGKIASAEEAARPVRDGDTVATGGFVGIGFAEWRSMTSTVTGARPEKPNARAAAEPFDATSIHVY
jgi:propionate CoA-transferase